MRTVSLAALQFSCSWTRDDNIAKAERLLRLAARQGAQVILLPELFETPYFCAVQNSAYYDLAHPLSGHPTVAHFRRTSGGARRRSSPSPSMSVRAWPCSIRSW